jgi:sugar phosphate isomerase/epimerase
MLRRNGTVTVTGGRSAPGAVNLGLETMDIGWCARIEQTNRVRAAGYDFIEVALAPMRLEDDAGFRAARAAVAGGTFPQPVFNQFLPRGMHVVGPDVDRSRVQRYLARAAEVLHAARAQIVVFGSGWARIVPAGWSRSQATEQFGEMVSWCTDAFHGAGITLALEAQNRRETNFITTLAEALAIAGMIHRPDVRVIADTYHLHAESESLDVVSASIDQIAHVHASDSDRRTPGHGVYDFDSFFTCLSSGGYRGRVSIEMMNTVTDDDMRQSLEFMRGRVARRERSSTTAGAGPQTR